MTGATSGSTIESLTTFGSIRPLEEPRVLVDRYRLERVIGRGGSGVVWAAKDERTGERVAVKVLWAMSTKSIRAVRRELSALRWLHLPGVARLRDDGTYDGHAFLVMDLIEGAPFPALPPNANWRQVVERTAALLEVLARVHFAGVSHCDLKPSNVLVDDQGRVQLLDFGLARGESVAGRPQLGTIMGTPLYMAPEQARGEALNPAVDLYAVGVMLYEALSGGVPHTGTIRALLRRRMQEPAPSLSALCPDLPPSLIELVDSLLDLDPQLRPGSAVEVLHALGGALPAVLGGRLPGVEPGEGPLDQSSLMRLFDGPDTFLHLREDAARVLWERTGGRRVAVQGELEAWVRAGLASWEGELLTLDRAALERLEDGLVVAVDPTPDERLPEIELQVLEAARACWPERSATRIQEAAGLEPTIFEAAVRDLEARGQVWRLSGDRLGTRPALRARRAEQVDSGAAPIGTPAHLRALLLQANAAPETIAEAEIAAAGHEHAGRLGLAIAALELALDAAREQADQASEHRLLERITGLSLAMELDGAGERALQQLERGPEGSPPVAWMMALVRGARACWSKEPQRALDHLDGLGPHTDETLEVWRQGLRATAALRVSSSRGEAVLCELASWAAGRPGREARLLGWRGNASYQAGHFAEAARLHTQASAAKIDTEGRLSSLINAGFALLEEAELDRAGQLAREAREEAARLRHARLELRACLLGRLASYRSGVRMGARPDLIQAALPLSPAEAAPLALNEAAVAWRHGDLAQAAALARQAAELWRSRRSGSLLVLAECFLLWLTGYADQARIPALAQRACESAVADHAVQSLGLLRAGAPTARVEAQWRTTAAALAQARDPRTWHHRLDLLSFDEALAPLPLPPPDPLPSTTPENP